MARTKQSGCFNVIIFPSKSIVSFIAVYRSLNRSALYTPFFSIFLKLSFTVTTSLMIGHAIPCIIGFQNFTDILPCSNNSPIKMGIRYSAFRGIARDFFLKELFEPLPVHPENQVSVLTFMDTREFTTATLSASAPNSVLTMFLVSTTSVRLFCSSILQIPRVTPPLSDRCSSVQIPPYQDLPPFTRSWTALKPSFCHSNRQH